jgi:hypothetical protein
VREPSTPRDLGSIAYDSDENGTLARAIELAQKNALPGTERELPVLDKNGLAGAGEDGLHVRIGVAFRVAVGPLVGNQSIENAFDIAGHVRIGVFVDGDARGSVRHEDVAESATHAGIADCVFDFPRDIDKLRALVGFDAKGVHAKHKLTGWE